MSIEEKRKPGPVPKYRKEYAITCHNAWPDSNGTHVSVDPPRMGASESQAEWSPLTMSSGPQGALVLWRREVLNAQPE